MKVSRKRMIKNRSFQNTGMEALWTKLNTHGDDPFREACWKRRVGKGGRTQLDGVLWRTGRSRLGEPNPESRTAALPFGIASRRLYYP